MDGAAGDLSGMTLEGYLDALASGDPAPGGGAVAALTAAQGAALLSMALAVTQRGHDAAPVVEGAPRVETSLKVLRQALLKLATEDGKAFGAVLAAYKIKAGDADAKAARKQAIDEALKGAAQVPLDVMGYVEELEMIALYVAERVKPSVASDVVIAARLLHVALKAGADNVRINLRLISDEAFVHVKGANVERMLEGRAKAWRHVRKVAKAAKGTDA